MPAIWETQQWPQEWKRFIFTPVSKKGKPKNVQTTVQLCLFHMLARWCSKSFKLGFNSTWTEKFQLYKLDWENSIQESGIKLPTSAGSQKKTREFQKNIYFCFTDYTKAFNCVDHNKLWKILKEMGIPDHLTCLLRNLYAGQEGTVRTWHGTKLGKKYIKAVYCHPAYLTSMQSTSWETLGWKKHKLKSRLLGEISITSDSRWHHPYGRKWRGTKQPLDESERGEWKSQFKTQHSEMKIMACSLIT